MAYELHVSLNSVVIVVFYDVNFQSAALVPYHTSHLRGAEKGSGRFGVLLLWGLFFDVGSLGLVDLSEKVGLRLSFPQVSLFGDLLLRKSSRLGCTDFVPKTVHTLLVDLSVHLDGVAFALDLLVHTKSLPLDLSYVLLAVA